MKEEAISLLRLPKATIDKRLVCNNTKRYIKYVSKIGMRNPNSSHSLMQQQQSTVFDYERAIFKVLPQYIENKDELPLCHKRNVCIEAIANQCMYFALVLRATAQILFSKNACPKVGIIGATGDVGHAVITKLLQNYDADCIYAHSRNLSADPVFASRSYRNEITCVDSVKEIVNACDLVILAIPPSQLSNVATKIKTENRNSNLIVVTVLAGVTCEKVSQITDCQNVLQTTVKGLEKDNSSCSAIMRAARCFGLNAGNITRLRKVLQSAAGVEHSDISR